MRHVLFLLIPIYLSGFSLHGMHVPGRAARLVRIPHIAPPFKIPRVYHHHSSSTKKARLGALFSELSVEPSLTKFPIVSFRMNDYSISFKKEASHFKIALNQGLEEDGFEIRIDDWGRYIKNDCEKCGTFDLLFLTENDLCEHQKLIVANFKLSAFKHFYEIVKRTFLPAHHPKSDSEYQNLRRVFIANRIEYIEELVLEARLGQAPKQLAKTIELFFEAMLPSSLEDYQEQSNIYEKQPRSSPPSRT